MKRLKASGRMISVWLCITMVLMCGCAHPLVVKNLDTYRSYGVFELDKPLKIGIDTDANEPEQLSLLEGTAKALGHSATVTMPYHKSSQKPVDVVANVEVQTVHEGSGWNFLVNWPGFLVWAPAWHGYVYQVKYTVHCTLTKADTKEFIDQFQIPIALDVRHAAINRTWTEISWLEVSVIAFVGGILFVDYDASVTPLVAEKVQDTLGKYIAKEIVKRLNASGKFGYIHEQKPGPIIAALPPADSVQELVR